MAQILVRRCVEGPSFGMVTIGWDGRGVLEARELREGREALEVRIESRPGISSYWMLVL